MRRSTWFITGSGVLVTVALAAGVLGVAGPAGAAAAGNGDPAAQRQRDFAAAAAECGAPEPVLLAVSYDLTAWEAHGGQQSRSGGYGPMHLVHIDADTVRGAGASRDAHRPADPAWRTLDDAAALLGEPTDRLRQEPRENIRGGAALLAAGARKLDHGALPSALGAWYPAVAGFTRPADQRSAAHFADGVYRILTTGAAASTQDGQRLTLAAQSGVDTDQAGLAALGLPAPATTTATTASAVPAAECPSSLDCQFVPAAYDWSSTDHSDPNNYGNYDPADRPADGQSVRYLVIHDTEDAPGSGAGPYDSALATFTNPAAETSAHYLIRSSDGLVTQLVRTKDVAWQAGNWTFNEHSIGIEHEGIAVQGGTWYTEEMYRSSAALVHYLAARYHIPLDRDHILGHDEIPREWEKRAGYFAAAHWDPGPYWDWEHYLALAGAPIRATGTAASGVVTIRPGYADNQPPLTTCSAGTCTALPAHGANIVQLHTAPSEDAPLIGDPAVHPDGSPGTTAINDWSATATAGRSYALADQQGDWTAIWFGGTKAWFANPGGQRTVAGHGLLVRAKAGVDAVPLYGRAFPDQAAYPATIPFDASWQVQPIPWTLPTGQTYVALDPFSGENYYARFDAAGVPANHTLVKDGTRYLLLSFNHRVIFVRCDDVEVVH